MSRVYECLLFLKYQGTFWFRQFSLIEQRSVYELYNCVAIQEYVPSDSLRFVDFSNFILLINSICDEVSFFLASHFLLLLSLSLSLCIRISYFRANSRQDKLLDKISRQIKHAIYT
jgi:hypothetical protein